LSHTPGHPPPRVTWRKEKNIIKNNENLSLSIESNNMFLTHSLVFDSISSEDYGNYFCSAENRLGQVTVSLELRSVRSECGRMEEIQSLLLLSAALSCYKSLTGVPNQ